MKNFYLQAGEGAGSLCTLQGDPSGWLKPPVDLVPTVPAADWPLLQIPTAQAG